MPDADSTSRTDHFLIIKRGLYYRPNGKGYTGIKDHAGRYSEAQARATAEHFAGLTPAADYGFIHEDDAPEYSRCCWDDVKAEHQHRVITSLRAELATREAAASWRPMETAPKNATNVLLRYPAQGWNKPQVIVAHWAHGGGEDQPAFGPGWFRAVLGNKGEVLMFADAPPKPDAWMPMPDVADA
jgi:hypothetical protein